MVRERERRLIIILPDGRLRCKLKNELSCLVEMAGAGRGQSWRRKLNFVLIKQVTGEAANQRDSSRRRSLATAATQERT